MQSFSRRSKATQQGVSCRSVRPIPPVPGQMLDTEDNLLRWQTTGRDARLQPLSGCVPGSVPMPKAGRPVEYGQLLTNYALDGLQTDRRTPSTV